MKEVLTVKLERSDIEDSISHYLADRGYKVKSIVFRFENDHFRNTQKVAGAEVIVTRKEESINE